MSGKLLTKLWEAKMDIWYKILNIVALFLIPIVAVIVGQKLQERAKKREDKMQVFKVLMTSRGLGWNQDMVWALNIIEVVFADDDAVIKQWRAYYDKLCIENPSDTDLKKIIIERNKLIERIANSLGYKDKITWETIQNAYIPKGMLEAMNKTQEFQTSQQNLMNIFQQMMTSKKEGNTEEEIHR